MKTAKSRRILVLVIILNLSYAKLSEAATRYVKADAIGSGNGTSWTNAYTLLESALTAATSGDQIWVARATYKPASQSASFQMKAGVSIYGGFVGTETLLSQRNSNPFTNGTILSGDLGVQGAYLDNCYIVVKGE